MEYRLEHLETLVALATDSHAGIGGDFTPAAIAGLLQESLSDIGQLQTHLVQQVFRFNRKKEIELFIQNYQVAITGLLDRLHALGVGDHAPVFVSVINPALYRLLTFIEDRFSAYFDLLAKVPEVYWELVRQEFVADRDGLLRTWSADSPVDGLYLQVLTGIDSFIAKAGVSPVTYKDILFYRDILFELRQLSSWSPDASGLSGIECLLLYLNYNDKAIVNTMVNRLTLQLDRKQDSNDKIDLLLLYSKGIQQLQYKPDSALHVKHPSVKAQLLKWLSEELYYQERKINQWTATTSPTPAYKSPAPTKVFCNATVDQLGIFFRAAADIQLLTTPSQRQLFNQISPYLATPHKKELSGDSMRSKSYNAEKKDLDIVKDLLMQLFKQITRY